MQNVASTIDEENPFDRFTAFSYMVREGDGYADHVDLAQDTKFVDRFKAVSRLEGKHFDKYNLRFYTSLRVFIANRGIG